MSKRRLVLPFVALITATGSGVGAEEPLGVEAYIQTVLRAHPAARQAAALDGAAAAESKAARLPPDPELQVSRGRAHATDRSAPATETGFSVSQTIPWPGTLAANVHAADRAADALRATAVGARWALAVEARRAFTQLAASRELLGIARAAEEDARSLRDLLARRADLGESRESDRIKATVEWLRQQRHLAAAEREAATAEVIVRRLAVEPLPQPLEIQPVEFPHSPMPDLAMLQARLADVNPALRAARAEAARQAALASAARRARIPDLAATFFQDHEIDKRSTGVSVGVKVPLWNANRGEIARAEAAALGAVAAAERGRIEAANELETRVKELQIAAAEVESLRREILPAARQSLGLARFSFEEGETSILDLLDAQRTFRDTQREAAEAGLALGLAWAELQRLLGPELNPWR